MFFAGFALIILTWFFVSLALGAGRNQPYAKLIGALFFVFLAAWGVGVLLTPAAVGSWSTWFMVFLFTGFTVSLLLAAGVQEAKERKEHRSFSGGASGEVRQDSYVTVFAALNAVTVAVALIARFMMMR